MAHDAVSYRIAWAELQARAGELGCRAWLFRAAHQPNRFVEFVEWKDTAAAAPPLAEPLFAELLAGLERFGPGSTDHLIEP